MRISKLRTFINHILAMYKHTSNPPTQCPSCQSKHFVKNGKSNTNKQRYRCKQCAYNFSIDKLQHGIDAYYVKKCLKLYLEGMGFRAIERIVGVSHVSVINWVKKYGDVLKKVESSGQNIDAVELDELCSYVGNKKKALGVASRR